MISIYIYGFQNFDSKFPYVYPDGEDSGSILPYWLENWIVFILVYNNFIPISLYVTVEMVNVGQGFLIANDKELYREEIDCACSVRASNLVQELGGVSNIFSDKTGTLTRNEMKLVKFVLNGTIYDVRDAKVEDDLGKKVSKTENFKSTFRENHQKFLDFCRCLVTCHTVVRESDGTYRAESPDELALVEAVSNYNCFLFERGTKSMDVECFGEKCKYECLAVNEFNSDRKRMSILIKNPENDEYIIMCKGADNIMLPLCKVSDSEEKGINKNLIELSNLGLRTLIIAQKRLSKEEATKWLAKYKAASTSVKDRDGLMANAAQEIEKDMKILGVTAIEDRLQDEVNFNPTEFIVISMTNVNDAEVSREKGYNYVDLLCQEHF